MRNFGAQTERRSKRIAVQYPLDVDTRKYQECMLNPVPLNCTTGSIIDNDVGDRYLKKIPHKGMKLIDGYISIYLFIINSPKWIDMINQANELAVVLGDIKSYCLGEK